MSVQVTAAKEAEHLRLEEEKKKPKMNTFTPGAHAPDILVHLPFQYALQKLQSFDYIELWYFSPPGRLNAAKYHNRSQADDIFSISKVDNHLMVRSIASVQASRNALLDHELSFSDFIQAVDSLLDHADLHTHKHMRSQKEQILTTTHNPTMIPLLRI